MSETLRKAPLDFPFGDVVRQASEVMAQGHTIHQKWTCEHCGARQTMDVPNVMYEQGRCEECSRITNIRARGCNFLVVAIL